MPDVARTLDVPSGQRFEYWKSLLSHTFVPLEVSSPGGGADFSGRLRGCELGEAACAWAAGSARSHGDCCAARRP
jgi:hypothetical protein